MTKSELFEYCSTRIGLYYCIKTDKGYLPPDYFITVPCGTCFACLKRKRLCWSFRLIQEMLQYKENTFITLTFDDYYLEKFKDNYKEPIKLYIDRLRKRIGYRPRYWFISEVGDEEKHTGRLHFHGIIFNTSRKTLDYETMNNCWFYGRSSTGWVNSKTCNYVTKYMLKFQGEYNPVMMCSNGIGLSYLDSVPVEWFINDYDYRDFSLFNNRKYPLSQYYRDKIYNEDMKLVKMLNRYLAIEPFESYLNGKKYTIESEYKKAVKHFYEYSLNLGLSKPKQSKNYGKICISKDRLAESWEV